MWLGEIEVHIQCLHDAHDISGAWTGASMKDADVLTSAFFESGKAAADLLEG